MKGIVIYEDFRGKEVVEAIKLGEVVYNCKIGSSDDAWTNELSGIRKESTQAYCNESDTYDFETGALIALMKMCGREKVTKACDELYRDDNYKNALQEMTESLDSLSKRYDLVKAGYDYWKERCKKLDKENKELKKNIDELFESEQHSKSELGRLYFEKHRLEEEVEKLKDEVRLKKDAINEWKQTLRRTNEKIGDLVCENEKLKLDCEKLQYGYNDTDMIFCGGRQNGKQYTFLVDLFKKIPKDKVQAAYKKAYGDRVIWCTSQPEVHPLSTAVLEGVSYLNKKFKTYSIEEWLYKPPTKREEMWDKIFELHKESDVIIEVKKEDVTTFLHEIEDKIPEITWATDGKIFEAKGTIKDIYDELKTHNRIYFRLSKKNKLSYSSDLNTYLFVNLDIISYLPPMRWDLFKKGRIIVGVRNNNELEEFRKEVERNTGIKNIPTCPTNLCLFYMFDKDNYKIILNSVTAANIAKINGHKVVYWEDVR